MVKKPYFKGRITYNPSNATIAILFYNISLYLVAKFINILN